MRKLFRKLLRTLTGSSPPLDDLFPPQPMYKLEWHTLKPLTVGLSLTEISKGPLLTLTPIRGRGLPTEPQDVLYIYLGSNPSNQLVLSSFAKAVGMQWRYVGSSVESVTTHPTATPSSVFLGRPTS